jgi:hypothetical protein
MNVRAREQLNKCITRNIRLRSETRLTHRSLVAVPFKTRNLSHLMFGASFLSEYPRLDTSRPDILPGFLDTLQAQCPRQQS